MTKNFDDFRIIHRNSAWFERIGQKMMGNWIFSSKNGFDENENETPIDSWNGAWWIYKIYKSETLVSLLIYFNNPFIKKNPLLKWITEMWVFWNETCSIEILKVKQVLHFYKFYRFTVLLFNRFFYFRFIYLNCQ